ncbi:hypothetical protein TSUD_151020 [Trifolium subterraneum]|uniref:Retrotransposon Copia-like N-terminal domain-containing protein n=1 Tax=Trifolium subterraneum TaxID=3900 RepID=A0A2Z6MIR4_TRISU|nr:hypothetical protein TSUD_151020 [Trifolium subterraneum]
MAAESSASVHGKGNFTSQNQAPFHNKGYQNNTLNPYFLHPNENPGLVLVQPLLSSTNYHSWSRAMTMSLKSKNKLQFIDGSLPRPLDEDHDSLAWDRRNTMIMPWLGNAVEAEISQSVLWMNTASEIWQDLKERFYQDIFRISDIQEEIYTLKQGDNSISTYYTKMKKMWKEHDNFRPVPISNCVHNYVDIAKMKEYKDSDQVIRFLKGLNEQYSAVRSHIMLMDPLPNISRVYSLLVQQERKTATPTDESKLLAMSGNNQYDSKPNMASSSNSYAGRGSKLCTHRGQTNHIVDNCWRKYGFPPHLQYLQNNGAVDHCANTNGDDDELNTGSYEEDNSESEAGKLYFTPTHHKALLALLQGSQSLP